MLECVDDESSSEDENDESFFGGGVDHCSSDEEDVDGEDDEAEGEEDEEDEDDEEDGDEEEDEDDDEEMGVYGTTTQECPGSDSGCTAVVALLVDNELYVANAGDSRCVVCRGGEALEMSQDHKPEDEPETERIVKAGGKVTCDGRVDGGLNLSRAIGDHVYKANKQLPAREQMITALPEVRTATLDPAPDEFMVLACDGIWNYMSSQEVVDFVRRRIAEGREPLSRICEELFEACLAPNTLGDGTGCDNMTAVIVQFRPPKAAAAKRDRDEAEDQEPAKRQKTDEAVAAVDAAEPPTT